MAGKESLLLTSTKDPPNQALSLLHSRQTCDTMPNLLCVSSGPGLTRIQHENAVRGIPIKLLSLFTSSPYSRHQRTEVQVQVRMTQPALLSNSRSTSNLADDVSLESIGHTEPVCNCGAWHISTTACCRVDIYRKDYNFPITFEDALVLLSCKAFLRFIASVLWQLS